MNRTLSKKQIEAIHLLVHEEMDKKQVAKKLDVAVSTIYAWLSRNEKFIERYSLEKTWIEQIKTDVLETKAKIELRKISELLGSKDVRVRRSVSEAVIGLSEEFARQKGIVGYECVDKGIFKNG